MIFKAIKCGRYAEKTSNMQDVPAILLTSWQNTGMVTAATVLSASPVEGECIPCTCMGPWLDQSSFYCILAQWHLWMYAPFLHSLIYVLSGVYKYSTTFSMRFACHISFTSKIKSLQSGVTLCFQFFRRRRIRRCNDFCPSRQKRLH